MPREGSGGWEGGRNTGKVGKKIQAEKTRTRNGLEENRKRDTGRGKREGVENRKRKKA